MDNKIVQQPFEMMNEGMTIRGTVYRPDGVGRGPAMMFLHGRTGQRTETLFMFVQLGRALARRGIAVATFDFRNSGESDGSFDQMLVSGELSDALAVGDWLARQPFADRTRLGILGMSLGGMVTALATAETDLFKMRVLLAPTNEANLLRLTPRQPDGPPAAVGPYMMRSDFIDDAKKYDSVAAIAKRKIPTLLVQGTGDLAVPPGVSDQFVASLRKVGAPVDHVLIEEGDHGFSSPQVRRELLDAVVQWVPGHL